MTVYVYALLAPGSDVIRYVGKSSNPARRLTSHASRSGAPAVRDWIAAIGAPELRILGSFPDETSALLAEQRWIANLHGAGQLLNSTIPFAERVRRGPSEQFSGFGERCVARRKALKLSQNALARAAGILQPALSRIESSERVGLTADSAVRIARALGCSVEWLVTGEDMAPRTVLIASDQSKGAA